MLKKMIKKIINYTLYYLAVYATDTCYLHARSKEIPLVVNFIMVTVFAFIVLGLYDLLIIFVIEKLSYTFYEKSVKNIENKKIKNAFRYIKYKFRLHIIYYYMRLNFVYIVNSKENNIYKYLKFSDSKSIIINFVKLIFHPVVIISATYVFVLKNNLQIYDFYSLKKLTEICIVGLKIENAWNYIEKRSFIKIIIVVLPLCFVGSRNRIKSIIIKIKNEKMKNIIEMVLELSSCFEDCLYKISNNMETLPEKMDYVVDKYLKNNIENYCEFSDGNYSCHCFDEIEIADEIEKKIKELFYRDNMKYFEEFSFYRPQFRVLYIALYYGYINNLGKKNKCRMPLFILLNPCEYIKDSLYTTKDNNKMETANDYEKLLSEKKHYFAQEIYDAFELLFYIRLFIDEFNNFIKVGQAEALIKEIANKSK